MLELHVGPCIEVMKALEPETIDCCVTSPPYWGLRDYGNPDQIGHESRPVEYVRRIVDVMREVRRLLRDDGTLWLNLGDSYAGSGKGRNGDGSLGKMASAKQRSSVGSYLGAVPPTKAITGFKPKDLIGIPWRVAIALQEDGWFLRQDIIWSKPNPMPESVTDRCTRAHEYLFLLSKSRRYRFDVDAIAEPGTTSARRQRRSVWTIVPKTFPGAHFATFPEELVEPCVLAGSRPRGKVLDPFLGSGTTAVVALGLGRAAVGIELNPEYAQIARRRIEERFPLAAASMVEAVAADEGAKSSRRRGKEPATPAKQIHQSASQSSTEHSSNR